MGSDKNKQEPRGQTVKNKEYYKGEFFALFRGNIWRMFTILKYFYSKYASAFLLF